MFAQYPNNVIKLADGQHRLKAVVDDDLSITFDFVVYEVSNDDEFGHLIAHLDQGTKRTGWEQIKSMGIPERLRIEYDINMGQAKMLLITVGPLFYKLKKQTGSVSVDMYATAELMLQYAKQYGMFLDVLAKLEAARISSQFIKTVTSGGVSPVALLTFKTHKVYAIEFWSRFCEDKPTKPFKNNKSNAPKQFSKWLTEFKNRTITYDSGGEKIRRPCAKAAVFC